MNVFFEFVGQLVELNIVVKLSFVVFEFVVANLQKLNFQFSMVAEPLVKFLRGERTFMIGAARIVAGRRHRLHRGRGWRYEAWLHKLKATNFKTYFVVKRSLDRTVCREIRYHTERLSTWMKSTARKKFHKKKGNSFVQLYKLMVVLLVCCLISRSEAMPTETPFEAKTF